MYKNKKKKFNETTVKAAVQEVEQGASIKKISRKYLGVQDEEEAQAAQSNKPCKDKNPPIDHPEPTPPSDSTVQQFLLDSSALNKYVAVLYTEPKRQHYWGKVLNISDTEVTVYFLKQKHIGSNADEWTWVERKMKRLWKRNS